MVGFLVYTQCVWFPWGCYTLVIIYTLIPENYILEMLQSQIPANTLKSAILPLCDCSASARLSAQHKSRQSACSGIMKQMVWFCNKPSCCSVISIKHTLHTIHPSLCGQPSYILCSNPSRLLCTQPSFLISVSYPALSGEGTKYR